MAGAAHFPNVEFHGAFPTAGLSLDIQSVSLLKPARVRFESDDPETGDI